MKIQINLSTDFGGVSHQKYHIQSTNFYPLRSTIYNSNKGQIYKMMDSSTSPLTPPLCSSFKRKCSTDNKTFLWLYSYISFYEFLQCGHTACSWCCMIGFSIYSCRKMNLGSEYSPHVCLGCLSVHFPCHKQCIASQNFYQT